MKKRFLCALLTTALCIGELVPVAAATTAPAEDAALSQAVEETETAQQEEAETALEETGDQAAEDAGEAAGETKEEAAEEAAAVEEAAEEAKEAAEEAVASETAVEAEEEEITSEGSIDVFGDIPVYGAGIDQKLTFSVTPKKVYYYSLIRMSDKVTMINGNRIEAGDALKGYQVAHIDVPLPFSQSQYTTGKYTLKVWEDGAEEAAEEYAIEILRSIVAGQGKATEPEVDPESVVYTGNDVSPKFTIYDEIGGKKVQLVQGKDFEVEVISANKKEIGTAKVKIRGMNENGTYTGTIEKDIEITPHAPSLPKAECASNTAIKVSWNKITEADGYSICRKGEDGKLIQVGECVGNSNISYVDTTNLTAGGIYEYQVRAYTASTTAIDQKIYSKLYTAGTKVTLTTAAPKITETTSISTKKVKLSWDKVAGAKGYNIYQVNKKGKLIAVKKNVKKNTYKVGKLTCGKTYKFTVKAYVINGEGKKVESEAAAVKSVQAKPATTKITEAKSIASTKVQLKWKKVSDCTGYLVYRKPTGEDEDWKLIATVNGASTLTYTDEKAQTGVQYAYTVASFKKVKKKKIKSLMEAKGTKVSAVSEGPTIVTEQRRENKANIFIKNVAGADGFYLYRKAGDGKFALVATLKKGDGDWTIYGDMKVAVGTTYVYYAIPYTDTDEKRVKGQKGAEATLVMKSLTATTKK